MLSSLRTPLGANRSRTIGISWNFTKDVLHLDTPSGKVCGDRLRRPNSSELSTRIETATSKFTAASVSQRPYSFSCQAAPAASSRAEPREPDLAESLLRGRKLTAVAHQYARAPLPTSHSPSPSPSPNPRASVLWRGVVRRGDTVVDATCGNGHDTMAMAALALAPAPPSDGETSPLTARKHWPGLAWPALPCPALPCPALPCPALPCPALPCPALPCPALPCPALPCPALPCPAVPDAKPLCAPTWLRVDGGWSAGEEVRGRVVAMDIQEEPVSRTHRLLAAGLSDAQVRGARQHFICVQCSCGAPVAGRKTCAFDPLHVCMGGAHA
ncbi:unnamed protein product [Closterium sp. NIES-53]